ncbi:restriction endonuclease [Leptolyngbya sp. FACHB-17]|uniref:restriction endonuclease n=1 Tax=unclassified Leptolyngbya TaxID=2650499 RepID=UPI0018EFFBA0|nr:restriction endonuclease [Leptolyngbya sp. FACHB-17]
MFKQIHAEFESDRASTDITEENEAVEESIAPNDTKARDDSSYRKKLLEMMLSLPSAGLERLCQRLLRESGFEQVTVTGRSGDGGIDGHEILQVNSFVSFKVLFQCKRYSGLVSSSQVRDFRGAMMGRADKGIILTTGTFTPDAQKEAVRDGVPPLELVHGEKLLDMFESLELGLIPRKTYDVDLHFFKEFQS